MRRLLLTAWILAASAQTYAENVRFLPPNPTSRTPVRMAISGLWGDGCPPLSGTSTVTGRRIVVTLLVSEVPCPIRPIRPVEYHIEVHIGLLDPGVYEVDVVVNGWPDRLLRTTLAVREAQPALVVVPPVVYRGDATVRIRSAGIGTCPDNVSPCVPPILRVTFHGLPSPLVRIINAHEIEAVLPSLTPPLPGGNAYDVVVTTDDGRRVEAKAALFIAGPEGPYNPAAFERVLIPIVFSGPGALGSRWVTEATIENPDAEAVSLQGTSVNLWGCGLPEGCRMSIVPPRAVALVEGQWPNGLFVDSARDNALRYQVLVKDLSRQAEALGAEIPTVRENDWLSGAVQLLNVPSSPRFRVALRVYLEGDVPHPTTVHVRVFPLGGSQAIAETTLSLPPANGKVPAAQTVTDLLSALRIESSTPLRVEIGAPPTGERLWAFASVTNNQTQHVTVISPQ